MNPLKMANAQAQGLDLNLVTKRNFDLWKAGELLLKITFGRKSDSQEAKYKEMRKTFLQTPQRAHALQQIKYQSLLLLIISIGIEPDKVLLDFLKVLLGFQLLLTICLSYLSDHVSAK